MSRNALVGILAALGEHASTRRLRPTFVRLAMKPSASSPDTSASIRSTRRQ